jgi:ribosomal protein S18 acetylase RimI-like enzyme
MQLKRASEADYRAIVELANLSYRGSADSPGWTTESSYIEGPRLTDAQLREELAAKPEAHLLTLRDDTDGLLLGTVWLEPKPNEAWYLGLLTIRPQQQNKQLGRGLLAAAEAYAAERGAKRIRMTVINIRVTLIAWYQRRGYVRTGESEPFPYGDARFGTPLRQDLSFVVLEKQLDRAELVMHRASA